MPRPAAAPRHRARTRRRPLLWRVNALRLALDAPEVVHSLVLLEPALLNVPSGALLTEVLGPVLEQYGAGDKEGAADSFLRWAIGSDYRAWLDRLIPGAFQQLVADADTYFGVELPSMQEWLFTREDARRITPPVFGVLGAKSASIWPRLERGSEAAA